MPSAPAGVATPSFASESCGLSSRIRERTRSVLLLSHFGAVPEVNAMCDLAVLRIRGWAEDVRDALARTDDATDEFSGCDCEIMPLCYPIESVSKCV